MAVKVRIPKVLRSYTKNEELVEVDSGDVVKVIGALDAKYPGIGQRLVNAEGKVHRFVNIFVNGEDIRFLQEKETQVGDGDEVSIVPAIAGGTGTQK